MILPFSTQLNGKPTYFVEKIHKGVRCILNIGVPFKTKDFSYQAYCEASPKIHTIREDKKNRWKPGVMIDFFINARQKNMFRFAPRIPVVSIQKIEINWISNVRSLEVSNLSPVRFNYVDVVIGGRLLTVVEVIKLARNDGFDSIEKFFEYFNTDFVGKIIHWTDLSY